MSGQRQHAIHDIIHLLLTLCGHNRHRAAASHQFGISGQDLERAVTVVGQCEWNRLSPNIRDDDSDDKGALQKKKKDVFN